MRQRSVRSDTAKEKAGSLLHYLYTKVACKPVSTDFANTVIRINDEPEVTVEQETADVTSLTASVYTQSEECTVTYICDYDQAEHIAVSEVPAIFHFLRSIKEKIKSKYLINFMK